MMNKFDAIIFDMDGLLVDSESVWYVAEEEFLRSFGHAYTSESREAIIGLRMDEFMMALKDYYKLPGTVEALVENLLERVIDLMRHEVKPQPGAGELIDYVVEHGIPHAIASSSPMDIINATLEGQGWLNHFPIRCSADDDANGKPAPDVYLRTARMLGHHPRQCLALEDSPNGSRAAVAAGMTCFAVPDPSHARKDSFVGITDHVYDSLYHVLEILKA